MSTGKRCSLQDETERSKGHNIDFFFSSAAAGYERVEVHVGDGSLGLPELAPFDAIAVAAAAPSLPEPLYDQLELRGRLAVPVGGRWGQRLELIVRSPKGPPVRSVPCRFVLLVGEGGFEK